MTTCACGCGNPVASGKTWIRGHNMRVLGTAPPAHRDQDSVQDPDPGGDDRWWETGGQPEVAPPLTYDQAASEIPDDPDPARMPAGSGPGTDPVRITAAVRRDIEGKLAFWGAVGTDLWNLADPYCAGVAADNLDKIAKKAAPLICQSPDMVRFFQRANGFMLWTELGMACKPVIVAIIAHHLTKKVQLQPGDGGQEQAREADWSAYTAA